MAERVTIRSWPNTSFRDGAKRLLVEAVPVELQGFSFAKDCCVTPHIDYITGEPTECWDVTHAPTGTRVTNCVDGCATIEEAVLRARMRLLDLGIDQAKWNAAVQRTQEIYQDD